MGKTLVIVESPSKAQKIQEYLGKKYIVMASKGHITELAKGGKFGIGVDVANNFKPHYVLMSDKVSTLDQLIQAAKESDNILLACDNDREGEAISWHLAKRLEDVGKPIKRMVFNEIKKDKILKSIKNIRDIDMNIVHAQEARRILDRLVGFTASPFLANFFQSNLSAGRVQSVLTRMVIEREIEIENFVPETFWGMSVNIIDSNNNKINIKNVEKIKDLSLANDTKKDLEDPNNKIFVKSVISNEEKRNPPPPLVTSSLQQIMSKKYGFGAERTMKAAQSLYEAGYCTYIRTDSVRAGDEAIVELRDYLLNNKYDIPDIYNIYVNKDSAQDAHECIRPSDLTLIPDQNYAIIDPDEKIVYETIWKYFVASQMKPAIFSTLKVIFESSINKNITFKTSGKCLIYKGFLEVLGGEFDDKIDIPNFSNGEVVYLDGKNSINIEKKQTQPPPRYSEDKLIKELVNKNIGRPATYADLLSKITGRNYVEKHGNVYHATELGKKTTKILSSFFKFMEYDYTANLESKLDKIEQGKENHIDMLYEFYKEYKKELDKAYLENGGFLCEKCKSPMNLKKTKDKKNKFYGCSAWPKCNYNVTIEQNKL